jgi:peroxiredoxin
MKHPSLLRVSAAVCIFLAAAIPSFPQTAGKAAASPGDFIGKKLPDFTLRGLDGKQVRLSSFAGKVILLDFWATWCPDCREVAGHIQEMSASPDSIRPAVITVSIDTKPATVKAFMEKNGYTFTVLMASKDTQEAFHVKSIPTVFLIDRKGIVRGVFSEYGMKGVPELEARVKALLVP